MSFYNNADWNQTFTVTSGGSAVDLTGKTLKMQWKAKVNDAAALVEASTSDGKINITDGPAGQFSIAVPYGDTQNVDAGNLYWDLIDIISRTSQTRIAGGRFLVRQGVTT